MMERIASLTRQFDSMSTQWLSNAGPFVKRPVARCSRTTQANYDLIEVVVLLSTNRLQAGK